MTRRPDPLIHERAPWLFSGRWHHDLARRVLMRLLRYPRTQASRMRSRDWQRPSFGKAGLDI